MVVEKLIIDNFYLMNHSISNIITTDIFIDKKTHKKIYRYHFTDNSIYNEINMLVNQILSMKIHVIFFQLSGNFR
jgi:uncharacterized radical SAM superfamily protein